MSYLILRYHLDLIAFACFLLTVMGLADRWIRRTAGISGFGILGWIGLSFIIVVGAGLGLGSGNSEKHRLENTISGLAPTYSREMSRAGLAKINEHTSPDDPTYLELINAQIRWQKDNATVADIYTMGKRADGKFILLVDSETDYNHSGAIDDDREKRTAIGEVYEEDEELLEQAIGGHAVFTPAPTTDRWGTWISTYVPVFDENGTPFAILGVDFDARQYVNSILWHRGAMFSLAGMIGVIMIGALSLITTLKGEMRKRELLHAQLVDASRKVGMAEIATGVLHNVGNALTSVNVSASLITEKIKGMEVGELAEAAKMLHGHEADMARYLTEDDAGKHVPEYVAVLADCIHTGHKALTEELDHLTKGIEHIGEIVRSQQKFAKSNSMVQETSAVALVKEAIELSFTAQEKQEIRIVHEIQVLEPVKVDKHKVLQILVNLMTNAKQAMSQTPSGSKTIVIAVDKDESGQRLRWRLTDTGLGIPPEMLPRIFQHGFTTKMDGHGFGLHSCANAATEMGGAMEVHSEGSGKGATFTLLVPLVHNAEVTV